MTRQEIVRPNHTNETTMNKLITNSPIVAVSVALLLLSQLTCPAQEVGGAKKVATANGNVDATPPEIAVFLIDDQTGEELAIKHGIQPLAISDLEGLINGVINGTTPVRLFHQAVDEDATDNSTAQLEFRPFAGEKPPTKPSPNMPLRQLAEAKKSYDAKRAAWQKGILDYRKRLAGDAEGFIRQVAETQGTVAERFDKMLAARNGRDFNRSDVFGCVSNASRIFGTQERRFLVLNTDAADLPGSKRKPRTTPLNPKELDPSVELIFVNTSRLPEQAPMFAGLPNPRHHANSMKEAMELIVNLIAPEASKETAAGEKGR